MWIHKSMVLDTRMFYTIVPMVDGLDYKLKDTIIIQTNDGPVTMAKEYCYREEG